MLKPPDTQPYISVKDHLVSGEEFALLYNEKYDMLITDPQPTELSKYYESEDYVSHTDAEKGLLNILYQTIKRRALRKKVKLIIKLARGSKSVLDIGAGTGDFLCEAKKHGWSVQGIEPNLNARARAGEKGVVLETDIEAYKEQQFDVVTLWHVLEHLPDLENTVEKIKGLVKENGILIVAVPNFKSSDAKRYKKHWAAYDAPRHLWHFSRNSLSKLFGVEMKPIDSKPMIFDSFYVSLLSEKYKNNNQLHFFSYPKAFFAGIMSNMAAWRSKEYSSLIYCFKKAQ